MRSFCEKIARIMAKPFIFVQFFVCNLIQRYGFDVTLIFSMKFSRDVIVQCDTMSF